MGSRHERKMIDALQAGKASAWRELFDQHYAVLCKAAAQWVGDDCAAESIVSDVMVKVWNIRTRLDVHGSLRAYLMRLDQQKPVILCGDLNVAHQEIDLKNPKTNRMNAGFTDQEREKFSTLLASGFTDTFRRLYPDLTGAYSWWSYRFNARANNAGWRIDYFLVSDRIADKIDDAFILNQIEGSDHCPVGLELSI